MIIIDEKQYAETRIKNKDVGDNVYTTLTILCKYYYSTGLKKKAVIVELQKFLEATYPKYFLNKSYWTETIEKTATKNSKEPLFESYGVWVTESEWAKIQSLKNKTLSKLAFTLLCIAKINNQKRQSNNNWVNMEIKDIFKMANISCSIDTRARRLCDLINSGMVEFAKRIDNLNLRVLFVDEQSEGKFLVNDFRDLGHEYLYRSGENYTRCAECGKLVKNNKYSNKKYCASCASYTPMETKTITCMDCGKEFAISAKNKRTIRCENCQKMHVRKYDRERKK